MSTSSNACAVCGKLFKRLQAHLAHNSACKLYYMSRVNAAATVAPIRNNADVNTTNALQGANHYTFPNLRTSLCKSSASFVREGGSSASCQGPECSINFLRGSFK